MRHSLALILVAAAAACQQSPDVPLVRALDAAASWAATVQYVVELEAADAVPSAYLDVVVKDAVKQIRALRKEVAELTGIPDDRKARALESYDRLTDVLMQSQTEPRATDVGALKQLQSELESLSGTHRQ